MSVRKQRSKWLAVKVESTKGTAATLGTTGAKFRCFEPVLDQDITMEERMPAGVAMGSLASVPGALMGVFRCRVELRGSGAAGTLPYYAQTLLTACALKNTNTPSTSDELNPISAETDETCVTIGLYEDGVLKRIKGAMGNAVITGEYGRRAFIEFDFKGVWVDPTDAAAPTSSDESTAPLRVASCVLTLNGSYHPKVSRFSLDLGNQIHLRPDIETEAAVLHAYCAERLPRFSFDPEAELVAAHDFFGKFKSGATLALSLQIGTTTGNRILITADKLQYADPKTTDSNGLQRYAINATLNATNGNDEFTIKFY